MMQRKYLKNLEEWLISKERKPLMVWGSRQVGKSFLIEELFCKKHFPNKYLKIDLSDETRFAEYAESNSLDSVLEYINLHYNFSPDKDHLLFFDEAQECPSIIKMMKQFCEKKREIPVIVSGSLVRIKLKRESRTKKGFLFPVGKINQLYIYPLTFDEFLFNYNEKKYNYVKTHYYDKKPIDEILHKELLEDFKLYMLLGGMPEVVQTFLTYKNNKSLAIKNSLTKLHEIYDDYLDDMSLYQTTTESLIKTKLIYKNVFNQLNKENKNFKISNVIKSAKNRDMIEPYFWLTTSGVVLQSFSLKERITLPLLKNDDSLFRFYLSDVGMFFYQSKEDFVSFMDTDINVISGLHYENFIATELTARKMDLFYWKGKRNSEFEFIINVNDMIVPIDIKKTRGSLYSLNEFRTLNKKDLVIKVSSNQYGFNKDENILTLPFYYFSFYLDSLVNK